MLNLIFLHTFIKLAQTKSFTKTATLLNMTQPGVSQHLKWLESYYETPLIVRSGKQFEITDQGLQLLQYGKQLFDSHDHFKMSLGTDSPHSGVCRFASPGSFGMKMYSFLLELNRNYPDLVINYSYAPNQTIVRDLLEDRIDVGFVTRNPEEPALIAEKFAEEELRILVPHNFNDNTFEGLKSLGFINHPDGFHHASRLLQVNFPQEFKDMDQFKISGFINQITRIPEPVGLGLGFTALPDFAFTSFSGKNKPKNFLLKKKVVDPIFKIQKKHRKLPSRFDFIFRELEKSNWRGLSAL